MKDRDKRSRPTEVSSTEVVRITDPVFARLLGTIELPIQLVDVNGTVIKIAFVETNPTLVKAGEGLNSEGRRLLQQKTVEWRITGSIRQSQSIRVPKSQVDIRAVQNTDPNPKSRIRGFLTRVGDVYIGIAACRAINDGKILAALGSRELATRRS
jgi:hypothetical protein